MLEKIKKNLREHMSGYTDSRQPTDDEVTIAWLVSEIDRLTRLLASDHPEKDKHEKIMEK